MRNEECTRALYSQFSILHSQLRALDTILQLVYHINTLKLSRTGEDNARPSDLGSSNERRAGRSDGAAGQSGLHHRVSGPGVPARSTVVGSVRVRRDGGRHSPAAGGGGSAAAPPVCGGAGGACT